VAWWMDIHNIDVGTGDATLIIVDNEEVDGARRSILIDGGLSASGPVVHDKVIRVLDDEGPDVLLVTHYDQDHSEGLTSLMYADNLSALVGELTAIATPYAVSALPAVADAQAEVAARVTCAVQGAMRGSWGANAALITAAVNALAPAAMIGRTVHQAIVTGYNAAQNAVALFPVGALSLVTAPLKRREAAQNAGIAAANAYAAIVNAPHGHPPAVTMAGSIRAAIFNELQTLVPPNARFHTGNIYNTMRIIDIGAQLPAPKPTYLQAAAGRLHEGAPPNLAMPGVQRPRTGNPPPLGRELFWNGVAPPALHAPYAVVVSGPLPNQGAGRVWQGQGNPAANYNSGDVRNDKSIGVVIRFNNFAYYTAGDMPYQGEDLLYPVLLAQPLPDGTPGGLLPGPPPPAPLAAFKCGHHGAATSTSPAFVANLQPVTAYISSGQSHGHPFQVTVTLLHNSPSVSRFYLTNCRYNRVGIPASPAADLAAPHAAGTVSQNLPGNKSRIAGDNSVNNLAPGRRRGNIRTRVLQAWSMAAPGARTYRTTYYESYPAAGAAPGMRNNTQTW
jgi:hypothetical protein